MSEMENKTFTIAEANMLLPVLESLLRRAIRAKELIEQVDAEFQGVSHKIYLNGGTLLDVVALAKRKSERERAVQQIKDAIEEIHATGVQVKDLEIGLLDFPCNVEGETVLLCWKLGEPHRIEHWHGLEEGFSGRKPIETLNLKRDKPDKPN